MHRVALALRVEPLGVASNDADQVNILAAASEPSPAATWQWRHASATAYAPHTPVAGLREGLGSGVGRRAENWIKGTGVQAPHTLPLPHFHRVAAH